MGSAKQRQLEEQERGYKHTGKLACAVCIGDPWLARVAVEERSDERCSYCGADPAAELDDVIGRAIECLTGEYRSESLESPPWDNEDKRYLTTPVDLGDLIWVHMSG